MAGKSMLELAQLASSISRDYTPDKNLEHEIIKVASREDLDANEIHTVTQRVNKGVIVPMHAKVASKSIPLDSTFKTASAERLISAMDRMRDAPKMATPTLPPPAGHTFKAADIQKHVEDNFGGIDAEVAKIKIKPAIYASSPHLVETIRNPSTVREAMNYVDEQLESMQSELDHQRAKVANLLVDGRRMAKELMEDETPAQIVRAAAADCPQLVVAIAADQRKAHIKEASALPTGYVVDSTHPFVKLACDLRDMYKRAHEIEGQVAKLGVIRRDMSLKMDELKRASSKGGGR